MSFTKYTIITHLIATLLGAAGLALIYQLATPEPNHVEVTATAPEQKVSGVPFFSKFSQEATPMAATNAAQPGALPQNNAVNLQKSFHEVSHYFSDLLLTKSEDGLFSPEQQAGLLACIGYMGDQAQLKQIAENNQYSPEVRAAAIRNATDLQNNNFSKLTELFQSDAGSIRLAAANAAAQLPGDQRKMFFQSAVSQISNEKDPQVVVSVLELMTQELADQQTLLQTLRSTRLNPAVTNSAIWNDFICDLPAEAQQNSGHACRSGDALKTPATTTPGATQP